MKTTCIILTTLLSTLALGAPTTSNVAKRANIQTFTGALGGFTATPIEDSGDAKRPFSVKGDTFVNVGAAVQRSCDQQFNACANAANGGDATLSVGACSDQQTQCNAAGKSITGAQAGNAGAGAAAGGAAASANGTAAAGGNAAAGGKKAGGKKAAKGCSGGKQRRSPVQLN